MGELTTLPRSQRYGNKGNVKEKGKRDKGKLRRGCGRKAHPYGMSWWDCRISRYKDEDGTTKRESLW